MRARTVNLSALGTNCWSAARFTNSCHTCSRYERCTYPERVPTEEYDTLMREAADLKAKSDALYAQAREMRTWSKS
jgi:hypothetical protein